MNKIITIIFAILIFANGQAQNVGQSGDTLMNYSDINGFKQGFWKKNYENGNLKYKAYFVNDKPIGDLKRYSVSGYLTAHLVYDSVGITATAEFFHRSGKLAGSGSYFGKQKDGVWKYYDEKGTFYLQESLKKEVKHGQFLQLTSEGVIIEETNWVDGVQNGKWIKRFAEGPLMWEATHVNGKLEGMTKTYYKSGVLHKEGKFVGDLMHGPWKKYNENGNLVKVYQYTKGRSPEADNEQQELLDELERNKDKYSEPNGNNDIDWLRNNRR